MSYVNIHVTAYSGHRGNERPSTLLVDGEAVNVAEIVDRWIEEDVSDRTRKRFFRIRTSDGRLFKIYLNEKTSEWFCEMSR
jgi:hypothetical protein